MYRGVYNCYILLLKPNLKEILMYQEIIETPKPRGKVAKALWKDIANVSRSGNAIARLVHGKANRRWSDQLDGELLSAYKALSASYRLGTPKERKSILQVVAIKTQRSPDAVKIRLGSLGVDLSRKKEVTTADMDKFIKQGVATHLQPQTFSA